MKIVVVSSEEGDWDVIYVDGILKRQGHSLGYRDAFEALDISYERKNVTIEEIETQHNGKFPKNLADLF